MSVLLFMRRIKYLASLSPAASRLDRLFSDKVLTLEVSKFDVIDNFTSDLVDKKHLKWERAVFKKPSKPSCLLKQIVVDTNLRNLAQDELDKKFSLVINDGTQSNIEEFIQNCQEANVCPSFSEILNFLDQNSRNRNISIVLGIKQLFDKEAKENPFYKANGNFDHYLAEAYWSNGEIVKALQLFGDVYRKQSSLRRRIKLMLRCLISELTIHSEAILVSIIKFSEQLYEVYKDPFPLVCVWQACFLSEWFSDQKLALELLEKHAWLCNAIMVHGNLSYVVTVSLKEHQVEVVYRLLEMLIKYDLKAQYSTVLVALFYYKFQCRDLKGCSEIIQWSVTYQVTLPNMVHEKFLMLLLGRTDIENVKPAKKPKTVIDLKF